MERRKTMEEDIDRDQSKEQPMEQKEEQLKEEKPYGRYANILTDSGFKAVFGDERNKEVLRDFLNEILPGGRKIRSMEYSTTEIPGLTIKNKGIRIDLRCKGGGRRGVHHRDATVRAGQLLQEVCKLCIEGI